MLDTVAYIMLGLFVIFGPGFLLSLVLFPKPGDFDFWQRVAVSFGLGVMLSIYIGALLSRPQFKLLTLVPFTEAALILFGFFAVVAYLRGGMAVPAAYVHALMRAARKPKPPTSPAQEQPKPPEHHNYEHPKPPTPPNQEQSKQAKEQD
jgi:uncharacterized membrane protein